MVPRLLISGILFIVALAVAFVFIWPSYQDYINLSAEEQSLALQQRDKENRLQAYREVAQRLDQQPELVEKLLAQLPDTPQPGRLIYFFSQTARSEGLIMGSIQSGVEARPAVQFGEVNTARLVRENRYAFDLAGSYRSFRSFIESLENSAHLINIRTVIITPAAEDTGALRFTVETTTHSY